MEEEDSFVAVVPDVYWGGVQVCPWNLTWAFCRWAGLGKCKIDKRESLQADVVEKVEDAALRWEYTMGEWRLCQHSREGGEHRWVLERLDFWRADGKVEFIHIARPSDALTLTI